MTILDDALLPAVFDMLQELGTLVTIEEVVKTGDPTTGIVSEGVPVLHTPLAIPPYDVEEKYVVSDVVKAGMMMTGIAGENLGFTPIPGMLLTLQTEEWEIVSVLPVRSGDSVCLWLLFLNN